MDDDRTREEHLEDELARLANDRPKWVCEKCGQQLEGDDGVVVVSYAHIQRYQEARRARAEDPPVSVVGDPEDHPGRAEWHVFHDKCGGEDAVTPQPYTISSGRIDTWAKVAGWTAHLHGTKTWFAGTTWDDLLRRAGAKEG